MNRKAWGIGGITLTKENWSTRKKNPTQCHFSQHK